MLTIYLDQAQWIDPSCARHGRADGARFASALDVAQQAVSMGLAQFPLSMGHYIETWRPSNSDRRHRLAQTMIELSQGRTMARPPDLCGHENIGWALERAGLPSDALGPIGLAGPDLPEEQVRDVLDELLPIAREFIAKLPTRDAVLRLRLLRHQNPATNWERNDMIDIAYLACAVVHCDLVVTEKQWVHELKRSSLLEEYDTRAMHNVAELPEVLVDLIG